MRSGAPQDVIVRQRTIARSLSLQPTIVISQTRVGLERSIFLLHRDLFFLSLRCSPHRRPSTLRRAQVTWFAVASSIFITLRTRLTDDPGSNTCAGYAHCLVTCEKSRPAGDGGSMAYRLRSEWPSTVPARSLLRRQGSPTCSFVGVIAQSRAAPTGSSPKTAHAVPPATACAAPPPRSAASRRPSSASAA